MSSEVSIKNVNSNDESEMQKQIANIFDIFDHEQNKTVDIREIGTIIRSLGYCPSESDLQNVYQDVEESHQIGYVHFDRFLPVMMNIIQQKRFSPPSSDDVCKALKILDTEGDGEIDPEYLKKLLKEKGEPFKAEEIEETLKAAINPATQKISYNAFAILLGHVEDE